MVVVTKEQLQRHGLRKLGGRADSSVLIVEAARQGGISLMQHFHGEGTFATLHLTRASHLGSNLLGGPVDLAPVVPVSFGDRLNQAREPRHVVPLFRRKVGATEEGFSVRSEKDGHGPAAAAGHHLHRFHVHRVQVGALLTVYLDVDEMLVHQESCRFVFKRLSLHDVAPVTSRVADAKENRFVLSLGSLQGLIAPSVPVYRVVRVL